VPTPDPGKGPAPVVVPAPSHAPAYGGSYDGGYGGSCSGCTGDCGGGCGCDTGCCGEAPKKGFLARCFGKFRKSGGDCGATDCGCDTCGTYNTHAAPAYTSSSCCGSTWQGSCGSCCDSCCEEQPKKGFLARCLGKFRKSSTGGDCCANDCCGYGDSGGCANGSCGAGHGPGFGPGYGAAPMQKVEPLKVEPTPKQMPNQPGDKEKDKDKDKDKDKEVRNNGAGILAPATTPSLEVAPAIAPSAPANVETKDPPF
jgi:hypothetical protein